MKMNSILVNRNTSLRGAYSGIIGGIAGNVLFGLYAATTIFLLEPRNFTISFSALALLTYLAMIFIVVGSIFAIPIGAVSGMIIGNLINAHKTKDKALLIGSIAGGAVGGVYPLILILTAIAFSEPSSTKREIFDGFLSLPGAIIAGSLGGLLAGFTFKRGYN